MARQVFVLAFIFLAVAGLVAADSSPSPAPKASFPKSAPSPKKSKSTAAIPKASPVPISLSPVSAPKSSVPKSSAPKSSTLFLSTHLLQQSPPPMSHRLHPSLAAKPVLLHPPPANPVHLMF
ncbi:Uncharacterized protein Fot_53755 [Forsythia ovata]|uniref:Uncharacterized protein n=1 Tax=Forsythia ovata TaxID=205694 RepID=A0ABD1PGL7_9LAMI